MSEVPLCTGQRLAVFDHEKQLRKAVRAGHLFTCEERPGGSRGQLKPFFVSVLASRPSVWKKHVLFVCTGVPHKKHPLP